MPARDRGDQGGCSCGVSCGDSVWSPAQRERWGDAFREQVVRMPKVVRRGLPPPMRTLSRANADVDPKSLTNLSDYQSYLSRRWRGPETRQATSTGRLDSLRNREGLHLGDSRQLGSLIAILPRGYNPMTDPDDMLTELVPAHPGRDALGEPMLQAGAELYAFGDMTPGLFWSGLFPMQRSALTHAVALTRGGDPGPDLLVGPPPPKLAATLEPDRSELRVDEMGRVRAVATPIALSWSHKTDVFGLNRFRWRAAMADYHFWWAHRLHSYAHEVSKSRWDLHLGGLAARRGIEHLAVLGDVVSHVDQHLLRSRPGEEA